MELVSPAYGLLFWTLVVPLSVLWIIALIDVLRNRFNGENEQPGSW